MIIKKFVAWLIQRKRNRYAEIQDAICEATGAEDRDNTTVENAICEITM